MRDFALTVDPETIEEPQDLVPRRMLRPADLLTAASGRLTAADFGITSPAVASSAEEAKLAMFTRKNKEREEWEVDLIPQGMTYVPMVASHFGSLHPTLSDWVMLIATNLARKQGKSKAAVNRQIRGRLGAALARRAARMSLATWAGTNEEADVPFENTEYDEYHLETTPTLTGSQVRGPAGDASAGVAEEYRRVRPFRPSLAKRIVHNTRPDRFQASWDPGPATLGWGSAHHWQITVSPVDEQCSDAYAAAAPACPDTDGSLWQ